MYLQKSGHKFSNPDKQSPNPPSHLQLKGSPVKPVVKKLFVFLLQQMFQQSANTRTDLKM